MAGIKSWQARLRPYVAVSMLGLWAVAALTGILLWVAPEGRQAGQRELLAGVTRTVWGDVHLWFSLTAAGVTVLHLAVDWRALAGAVHHLMHPDRAHAPE